MGHIPHATLPVLQCYSLWPLEFAQLPQPLDPLYKASPPNPLFLARLTMTAAAPSSISPQFRHGAKIAPRFSPPPPITVRSPRSPRFSAAYTSTAERERERGREREKIPSSHYCGLSADYMATASASLYDVLGLSAGATCQEIKQAYRRLARACHPDVVAADYKDTSADRFMRIHAAYSTLSDPNKRADYDCFLLARRRRFYRPAASCSSAPSFSRFGRRTWETDQCW